MALPTLDDVKGHFQRNYKFYYAIGLALLIALGLFLLTFFWPTAAFFVAGTLGFLGWEAATAFSTLAIAGIVAGIGAVASLFCSIVATISHCIKSYLDKKLIMDPKVDQHDDEVQEMENKGDNSQPNSNVNQLINEHGYDPQQLEPVPDVNYTDFDNENHDVFFLKKKTANVTFENVVISGLKKQLI